MPCEAQLISSNHQNMIEPVKTNDRYKIGWMIWARKMISSYMKGVLPTLTVAVMKYLTR